jgi:hypothetical protein
VLVLPERELGPLVVMMDPPLQQDKAREESKQRRILIRFSPPAVLRPPCQRKIYRNRTVVGSLPCCNLSPPNTVSMETIRGLRPGDYPEEFCEVFEDDFGVWPAAKSFSNDDEFMESGSGDVTCSGPTAVREHGVWKVSEAWFDELKFEHSSRRCGDFAR